MNVIKGFATTFKHLLEEPVTIEYPEQVQEFAERYKGRHELKRYDNGLEKCIGCALCAASCPADAIWVEAAENTDEARFSPGERYAKTYEINMLRCIFCGYCEDACPTEAIVFGDLNDAQSRVAKLQAEQRNYTILADLNTRPRTSYLGAVRNVNPEIGEA